MTTLLIKLLLPLTLSQPQPAMSGDSLSGVCYNRAGERCAKNVHRISTSWNSTKAYPDRYGAYRFEFGRSVDTRLTVYCDGSRVGEVYVSGNTRFDVHCP